MNPYVAFLLYLLAILGFVAFTLLLNRVLGPKPVASAMKLEPFECGVHGSGRYVAIEPTLHLVQDSAPVGVLAEMDQRQ